MAIKNYPLQALARWKHVFGKTYLIIVPIAALLVAAVLFILQSSNLKNSMAEFTGKISGLLRSTSGVASRSAIVSVVDPTTKELTGAKKFENNLSSYQTSTSPGLRMAILKVWDFNSKVLYSGSSRIFNLSAGQTQKADIALKEAGTFNDISAPVSFQPAVFNTFTILSKSLIAYAAEEKPVFAVIKKPRPPYGPFSDQVADVELTLVLGGNSVIATDQQSLDQIDEERNLKDLPPDTYGDFKPSEPNFVVEVDISFNINAPIVTISIKNVESQQVFWRDTTDSRTDTRTNFDLNNVVQLAADKLVESLHGKGNHPVKLPKFTPSVPKPVTMAEWRVRLRKLLGLDKQESATGTVGSQTPSPTAAAVPKPNCDFDGFVACRDKFNLQGCIDACPFVNRTCPEGTSPDTECKATDEECSNKCWDQGNSQGSQCAAMNHCSMKEIEDRLRAQ